MQPPSVYRIIMKKIIIFIVGVLTFLLFTTLKINTAAGKIYMEANLQNLTQDTANFSTNNSTKNSQLLILEIKITSLSKPFFGTAFHIDFDKEKYEYQGYELGNFFTQENQPIVLIRDNHDGIIMTGISLIKNNQTINKSGTLLKLNFKPKSKQINTMASNKSIQKLPNMNDFQFSHTVFSTFKETRKDIKNFVFENLKRN